MKLATSLTLLSVLSGATAFAPATRSSKVSTRFMSEEEAPAAVEEEAAPEPEPAPAGPDPVLIGMTPLLKDKFFFGKTEWDKLTKEYGSEATGTYIRAAELKHGRSAMVATVGYLFHKLGLTFDHISPHEYLSVTEGVKFADLAAMTPPEAMHNVPAAGLTQMFAAIAAVEIYELTHKNGEFVTGEGLAPGLRPNGLTGDLGWNPLNIEITDRRRLVEIQNGRAAMFAICAWVAHDTIPGSMPLPLPWN